MTRILAGLLGMALLLALGLFLYHNIEPYTRTIKAPPGAAARRDPLLAAQRLLQAMHQAVAARRGSRLLNHLPPSSDALLLYHSTVPLGPARLGALLDWVHRGGTLVMDVGQFYDRHYKDAHTLLLRTLGIGVKDTGKKGERGFQVRFAPHEQPVEVRFSRRYRLYAKGRHKLSGVGDRDGLVLVQIRHGTGLITLVNDLQPIDNRHIGQPNQAYLLYQMVAGATKTWLLYAPYRPSLAVLLWQHARLLVLSLLLLGVLWVWRRNLRIGPFRESPGRPQRDLFDHLDAQGGFDWRHGLVPTRFRASQQGVLQRWLSRYPDWKALDRATCAQRIAARTGRDPAKVRAALFEDFTDQPDFVQRSRLLQALWHTP